MLSGIRGMIGRFVALAATFACGCALFAACQLLLDPGSEAIEVFAEELAPFRTSKGAIQLPHDRDLPLDLVRRIVRFREPYLTNGIETRRSGSGSLGVAQVATGEVDGYVERYINSWDVAAALLMVTEAGGVVSDFFEGNALTEGNHILAASPWLAPRLTELTGITVA